MAGNCIFVVKFGGKLDRQSSTWNFWREIGPSGHEKIGGKLDLCRRANLAGNWIFGDGEFGGKLDLRRKLWREINMGIGIICTMTCRMQPSQLSFSLFLCTTPQKPHTKIHHTTSSFFLFLSSPCMHHPLQLHRRPTTAMTTRYDSLRTDDDGVP